MPWKNGQGATHEIAVHPENASLDNFAWRISLAQVNAPGLFSVFRGCDRTLCVVKGGPLVLSVANAAPVRIEMDSPFSFPADVVTEATALEERVLDFNVMVRRDHFRSTVECFRENLNLHSSKQYRLVFVKEGMGQTAEGESLRHGDTLLVGTEEATIATSDSTVLYVVTLTEEADSRDGGPYPTRSGNAGYSRPPSDDGRS